MIDDTLSTLMNGCSTRNRGMNEVTLLFSVAKSRHLLGINALRNVNHLAAAVALTKILIERANRTPHIFIYPTRRKTP